MPIFSKTAVLAKKYGMYNSFVKKAMTAGYYEFYFQSFGDISLDRKSFDSWAQEYKTAVYLDLIFTRCLIFKSSV